MRIPRRWLEIGQQSVGIKRDFLARFDRQPTDQELANLLELSGKEWQEIKMALQNRDPLSLDMAVSNEEEVIRFSGVVSPSDVVNNQVTSTQVADARIEYRGSGAADDALTQFQTGGRGQMDLMASNKDFQRGVLEAGIELMAPLDMTRIPNAAPRSATALPMRPAPTMRSVCPVRCTPWFRVYTTLNSQMFCERMSAARKLRWRFSPPFMRCSPLRRVPCRRTDPPRRLHQEMQLATRW
jgi:hypothetical protein